VTGRTQTISRTRGKILELVSGEKGLVTVHPSYLLRIEDEADKKAAYAQFVDDLRMARRAL
jgi:DNA polymerase